MTPKKKKVGPKLLKKLALTDVSVFLAGLVAEGVLRLMPSTVRH